MSLTRMLLSRVCFILFPQCHNTHQAFFLLWGFLREEDKLHPSYRHADLLTPGRRLLCRWCRDRGIVVANGNVTTIVLA